VVQPRDVQLHYSVVLAPGLAPALILLQLVVLLWKGTPTGALPEAELSLMHSVKCIGKQWQELDLAQLA